MSFDVHVPRSCFSRLQEILEVAEDMAIDIPHIWLYLAELITPMLHEGGLPMGELFRFVVGLAQSLSSERRGILGLALLMFNSLLT